jgi:hypothetical protein
LSVNHFSIFSNSDLDLDPRGSKCNTNQSFHIRLLNTKFDYNTSFQTLVIVRKPWCGPTDGPTDRPTDQPTDRPTSWLLYTPPKLRLWGYNNYYCIAENPMWQIDSWADFIMCQICAFPDFHESKPGSPCQSRALHLYWYISFARNLVNLLIWLHELSVLYFWTCPLPTNTKGYQRLKFKFSQQIFWGWPDKDNGDKDIQG